MTINKTIYFFHVDDEILRLSWIPSALRICYYQKHRDKFVDADAIRHTPVADGVDVWSFCLMDKDICIQLHYTIVDKGEKLTNQHDPEIKQKLEAIFQQDLATSLDSGIIILDLMATNNETIGQSPVGIETLNNLLSWNIDKNKVYMLTAFEDAANMVVDGKLSESHILTKPIDATVLAPILLNAAGVSCND